MDNILKFLIILSWAIMALTTSIAQNSKRHQSSRYTQESGMANQIIIDIEEDNNGFIWMISDNSLQWFDGSKFHEIPYGQGIHQIPATQFLTLHKTKDKELWIFYAHGFSVYNNNTHSFVHYNHLIPYTKKLFLQPVVELDDYFLLENGFAFYYIDKKTRKIVHQNTLSNQRVMNGIFNQATFTNPVIEFSKGYVIANNFVNHSKDSFALMPTLKPFTTYVLNEKQILIFDDSKVYLYNLGNFSPSKQIVYPDNKKLVSYQRPVSIIKKDDNTITIILDDELWEFNLVSLQFTKQITNLQNKPFLSNGYFKSIFYDSKNNLWAGSNLQGLFKINASNVPIQIIKSNIEKDNFVKCFEVNNNTNKIIVGTYGSGLQVFDTLGNHLKNVLIAPTNLPSFNIISSIGKIDNYNYLVLVFNNTTQYLFNTKNYTLTALKNIALPSFQPNYYSQLTELGNNQFLYLKQNDEFYFLSVNANNLLIRLANKADSAVLKTFNSIPTKSKDLVFFETDNYFTTCIKKAKLDDVSVSFLCKWKTNWLVGTNKGAYLFDSTAIMIAAYTKQTGLPNENINAFIIDKDNNAWCSHNKGISKLKMDGTTENFTKEDGLQDDEFNYGAASIDENGKLYFGGINGISSFYPQELKSRNDSARFLITGITASNNTMGSDTSFWNIDKINLSYYDNQLTIFFTAIGLHPSNYYNFQYRIPSISSAWIDLKHQNQLNLALPAGSYKIEFAVGHNFSNGMLAQKIIAVNVSPPYYKSWWFITLAAIGFILAVFYSFRSINKKKYAKQLEVLKNQEALEIERQRISRDLHDNIGAYTSALIANVEKLKSNETNDNDIARMKENAGQILSSLRETIWVLNNKEVSVADFSDNIKSNFLKILQNFPNLALEVDEKIINNKNISATTAIHLSKILQEALQNVIKHSKAKSIWFNIKCNSQLEIKIIDDGIGFNTSAILKGNGLSNMEWRAKEAAINLKLESTPGVGTIISMAET